MRQHSVKVEVIKDADVSDRGVAEPHEAASEVLEGRRRS